MLAEAVDHYPVVSVRAMGSSSQFGCAAEAWVWVSGVSLSASVCLSSQTLAACGFKSVTGVRREAWCGRL